MAWRTARRTAAKRGGATRTDALDRLQGDLDNTKRQVRCQQKALARLEAEHKSLSERFVHLEEQATRLTFLYTTAYQLLESLDRKALITAISETIINIVGSEDFALYERDAARGELVLIASVGTGASKAGALREGEGELGRLLSSGDVQVASPGGLVALVPLRHGGELAGALVIFRLLPHKSALKPVDRELLELLSGHAAQAFYCARLHEAAQGACT